ncbi:hypothetical protein OUZ56_003728 [Daphnia magna]|uniref:Integrase catalytic domain-containing protein n=1 Tax=Daphnia magna TaxID=35525 RepID=A0ABR0A9Y7_9CRUS|nr:hypothetical protein OUZ56_003728 [Daphnia magna]
MVRKYIANGFEQWEEVLGPMASAYRNSVHSSTMESPDPNMVVDRFLRPEPELITPRDYKSKTMQRLIEGFALARENLLEARRQQKIQYDKRAKEENFEVGDRVLLDVRVTQLGTSKKLNPRYQGPFRVSKVFPNHTVEIRAYNGNGTQLTHVNRLKALTECMIWRDEECVDFDDLRESKLRATRLREEDSDNEEDFADVEAGDEVNTPDHEGDGELIDLDAVAPNDVRDAHLINFDPLIHLNQTAKKKTNGHQIEPNLGHEPSRVDWSNLPPPLTPLRVPPAPLEESNTISRPKRATRPPDRFRDFLLD